MVLHVSYETIDYNEELAETNLRRNDWSSKETDMRGSIKDEEEIQNENNTDALSQE